jgi:hypothetical protein
MIYDYPHKTTIETMFKDKGTNLVANNKAKHDKALVNMVSVIAITCARSLKT